MTKPRVAILCPIDSFSSSYSLTEVILEQIRMLARHGYPTRVWAVAGCDLDDPEVRSLTDRFYPRVKFEAVIPRIILHDYHEIEKNVDERDYAGDPEPSFEDKVGRIRDGLRPYVEEVDLILEHDLLFQTWYLPHGIAIRQLAADIPYVRWIHWQHSGPHEPPNPIPGWPHRSRWEPMDHSVFVYINENHADCQLVAANRGIPLGDLAFVPNSRDIQNYLGFSEDTQNFVRKHGLLEAELFVFYPTRLCDGKQPNKAVLACAALHSHKRDVRLVFAAAHAPPQVRQHRQMITDLRALADRFGFPQERLIFTSESNHKWAQFTPRSVVRDLQLLADLFILPSVSEAHSLVAAEAAMCRQTLLLNQSFPAMAGWFPPGACHQWHFGGLRRETSWEGESQDSLQNEFCYYQRRALSLLHAIESNPTYRAFSFQKRYRNEDYVFKRHLEPVLQKALELSD